MRTSRIPTFPSVIDSTMVAAFRSCERKFFLEFCGQFSSEEISVHLHAGAAIAEGLNVARTAYFGGHQDKLTSLALGVKALFQYYGSYEPGEHFENKSAVRCASALVGYFDYYGWDTDPCRPVIGTNGQPAVEYTMSMPLPLLHPVTREPIIYAGRSDFLGLYHDMPVIVDDKTSSSLGAQWANQWALRSQFLGYAFMAWNHGLPVTTCVVRGIGLLRTELKYQQAIVPTPRHLQERWYEQLLYTVSRMTVAWEAQKFAWDLGDACAAYGGCQFRDVCMSSRPNEILASYKSRHWNPLAKDPTETREKLLAAA